jgi:hypothetical protein
MAYCGRFYFRFQGQNHAATRFLPPEALQPIIELPRTSAYVVVGAFLNAISNPWGSINKSSIAS